MPIDALLKEMATKDDVPVKPEAVACSNDVLWKASARRDALEKKGMRNAYFKVLRTTFAARSQQNTLLDDIVSLPFSHFLTTNYDPSIHIAFRRRTGEAMRVIDAGLPSKGARSALRKLKSLPAAPTCIHFHGLHTNPKGIILTESDYRARYISDPRESRYLAQFLEARAVVFFDFSLEDADFMNVLKTIRSRAVDVANPEAVPNFAFSPLSDADPEGKIISEKQRLSEKYRNRPIFFRRLTENYSGLGDAVAELESAVSAVRPSASNSSPALKIKYTKSHTMRTRSRGNQAPFVFREVARKHPFDPEDPNRGAFGGLPERNRRRLSATVKAFRNAPDWFRIDLRVTATDGRPFRDPGEFFVHPSFPKDKYQGQRVDRLNIKRKFWAYGAFTVGVLVDGRETALELDLSKLPDSPKLLPLA
jgi:hypothetical protein